ncbi:MAG: cytochrome c [Nitrospirales bacterium]
MLFRTIPFLVLFLVGPALPAQSQESQIDSGKGQEVYQLHCVSCHGIQGKGDGPEAAKLIVPPANFHRPESRSKTEMELRSAIIWGLAFSPMHGWWDKISVEDIRAVTAYIRRLAPFAP